MTRLSTGERKVMRITELSGCQDGIYSWKTFSSIASPELIAFPAEPAVPSTPRDTNRGIETAGQPWIRDAGNDIRRTGIGRIAGTMDRGIDQPDSRKSLNKRS